MTILKFLSMVVIISFFIISCSTTDNSTEHLLYTLDSKTDNLESKINNLEGKVSDLESVVSGLESKVDDLEAKCDKLESNQFNIKFKVNTNSQIARNNSLKISELE